MRMAAVRWAGAVAVLAAALTACATPPPPAPAAPAPPVNRTVTLDSPSGPRIALVHRPTRLPDNAPLVVVLHGAYGTAERTRASFGWDALADRSGFVVAYPDGFGKTWNAGNCCGAAQARGVDDVSFLHRLVEQLVAEDGVDQHRVYAVGMSNGAMMTYAWACARPDDLAGIGPVAGALMAPCKPTPTMKVVAIHGTADRNVPINGGVGPRSVTHRNYPSLAATIAPFVAADECAPEPRRSDKPPVQLNTWTCAGQRHLVVLAVVNGMGHEWPGSRPADGIKRVLRQPPVLDATTFLWTNLRSSVLS
jgi:polyhydroxybutyrate depolymerase